MKTKENINFGKKSLLLFMILILMLTLIIFSIRLNRNKLTGHAIETLNSPNQTDAGIFNLKVEIPESYKNINIGKPVVFTAKVLNLANDKRVDITLKYYAIDSKDNIIFTKSETLAVETQASFVREIKLSPDTPFGDYTVKAEIIYNDNKEAESQDSFKIIKDNKSNIEIIFIVIVIVTIIFLILIFSYSRIKHFIERMELKSKIGQIVKKKMK